MAPAKKRTGAFHYGTSSWSEKSWKGVFYPSGTKPGDYLRHYATQFGTVEADVTYYRVPDAKLVRSWKEKTPEGFLLSAKFPRSIVHAGEGARPDASKVLVPELVRRDTERFLESMALLGSRCGPLVLQFPYFNRSAFASPEPFLERLAGLLEALPGDFRYAVEIRNRAWLDEQLLELLRAQGTALVWADLPYMPHPAQLAARGDLTTADFAYVRLIGDRRAVEARTESFDRIVLDQGERLQAWAELLLATLERAPETYAYANNHFAGHGPETIRDLARRMGVAED